MTSLIRKSSNILKISPYVGGDCNPPGTTRYVGLSSNENPLGPSPKAVEAMQGLLHKANLYPDSQTLKLRERLAEQHGLNIEQILTGNGSDEILRLLLQVFAGPGDEVIFGQYAFPLYEIITLGAEATPIKVPTPHLTITVDDILKHLTLRTRMVILDNPSNPIGHMIPKAEIYRLHRSLPQDVLLVLDGAYAEYVQDSNYSEGLELIEKYDNVIVTRTFSKFYGLASMRIGWAYGSKKVIDFVKRLRLSFCCNTLGQAAAVATLEDNEYKFQVLKHYHTVAPWFCEQLKALNIQFIPSYTNFVLVDFGTAKKAEKVHYELAKQAGIIVRPVTGLGLAKHLRISYGLKEDMKDLVKVLQAIS